MTVSTTNNRVQYVGDNIVVSFSFAFITFDAGDIEVYLDGVLQGSGFSVNLNPDQDAAPGGDVVFSVAPGSSVVVTILRNLAYTQLVDYQPFDAFPAETHETALDRLTLLAQQNQEEISRAVKSPVTGQGYDLPSPEAEKILQWNATADGIENSDFPLQTYVDNATTEASNAAASAAAALVSENNAATSAANAATSAANAATSEGNAATSEANAAASYDSFDDRYLGSKTSDPTTDNDGDPLLTGAIYWNSVSSRLRVWNGTGWEDVYAGQNNADTLDGFEAQYFIDAIDNITVQWTSGRIIGTSLIVVPGFAFVSITALKEDYIAYLDGTNDELRTYRFDGSTWVLFGTPLSVPTGPCKLTRLSDDSIAVLVIGFGTVQVYTFDFGTGVWTSTGSPLSVTTNADNISALNSTDIAYLDGQGVSADTLETYRFNGSTWAKVGNTFTGLNGDFASSGVATLSSTRIAVYSGPSTEIKIYDWDGTDWVKIGDTLTLSGTSIADITALNASDIALVVGITGGEYMQTYRFLDNGTWVKVGLDTPHTLGDPAITTLNSSDIVVAGNIFGGDDTITLVRFDYGLGTPPSLSF